MLFKFLRTVSCLSLFFSFAYAKVEVSDIEKWSLQKKIGQLFIFGISGKKLTQYNRMFLRKYRPGHIIFFDQNIKSPRQVSKFISSINRLYKKQGTPLPFIALDQEGGTVSRIKMGFNWPSALAIGKTNKLHLSREYGYLKGALLKKLGFSMNLAPVLDISNPDMPSFIGSRTFGLNSQTVGELATTYAKGLKDSGVLPVAKHFPGHGNTTMDSHLELPKKLSTFDNLSRFDLKPFAHFFSQLPDSGVMVAHVSFPNIDATQTAATFSPLLNEKLIRKKLSYKGVVITDDLEMTGAATIKDVGERAVRAFLAGGDVLMLAWTRKSQRAAFNALYKAVKDGRISMERINSSVKRIQNLKNKFLYSRHPSQDIKFKQIRSRLSDLIHKVFDVHFSQIKNRDSWRKLSAQPVIAFASNLRFLKQLQNASVHKTNQQLYFLSKKTRVDKIQNFVEKNPKSYKIFYLSSNRSKKLFNSLPLSTQKKFFVINSFEPGVLSPDLKKNRVANIYFNYGFLGSYLAKFLNPPKVLTDASR